MNIKAVRTNLESALVDAGLEPKLLLPRKMRVWAAPGTEILRFFSPHPVRMPWGFAIEGFLGLEIPALRQWLASHKEQAGVFHTCFVGFHTANDPELNQFNVEHGEPLRTSAWARLIAERLQALPSTIDELIPLYRRDRGRLGWLAEPNQRHAWDFLLKWRDNPDPSLRVPRMLENGQVV